MKIRILIAGVALTAVSLGLPCRSTAGIALSFDQSNYTISSPGGTATLEVYVQQTTPLGTNEPTVDSSNGLVSGSVRLDVTNPSIANVLDPVNDATPGPVWDSGAGDASPYNGSPSLGVLSLLGIDLTNGPVLLGTFRFTGLSSGSTLVVSAVEDPSTQNFTDANGANLDSFVTGSSATITVLGTTAAPEPSTLVGGSLAAVMGLAFTYRRRARRNAS